MKSTLPWHAAVLRGLRRGLTQKPAVPALTGFATLLPGRRRWPFSAALAVSIAIAATSHGAAATILTWDGDLADAVGSSNWGAIRDPLPLFQVTNWNPNLVASSGDKLIFAGGSLLTNNNDLTALSVSALSFAAGASAFTLNGNAITSLGNITNLSGNPQTINLPITTGGDQIWNGNTAGMTFNGAISLGNNGLTLRNNTVLLNPSQSIQVGVDVSVPLPLGGVVVHNGGNVGFSSLTIESGARVESGGGQIAATGSATVTVTGIGSKWVNSGGVVVGTGSRSGALNILSGGTVESAGASFGASSSTSSTVVINGPGSKWINSGDLSMMASSGSVSVLVANGAQMTSRDAYIGVFTGGLGTRTVTVTDAGSTWSNSGDLIVGDLGTGDLIVANGGVVSNAGAKVGGLFGTGAVTVTGAGSQWIIVRDLLIGESGNGILRIANGGLARSALAIVGADAFGRGNGRVAVSGAGSRFVSEGLFVVKSGTLTIENGAQANNGASAFIGNAYETGGVVTVTGPGSKWTVSRATLGFNGDGTLNVENGGTVNTDTGIWQNYGSSPTATVSGEGSKWVNRGGLSIGTVDGSNSSARLNIMNGGTVETDVVSIGRTGVVAIDGGTLRAREIKSDDGQFHWSTGTLSFTGSASIGSGILSISQTLTAGKTLQVADTLLLPANGELVLAGGTIGAGAIQIVGGTLRATSDTNISGNLTNNGKIIGAGGTLTFLNQVDGAGSFAGNIVFKSGYSPGNSPATIEFNGGDVSFDSTSELNIEVLGNTAGTEYDQLVGINRLGFNGKLNLSFGNGFVPTASSRFSLLGFASFAGSLAADRIFVTGFDKSQLDFSHLAQDGSFSVTAVPEPVTYTMFAAGLGLMGLMVRRRRTARPA